MRRFMIFFSFFVLFCSFAGAQTAKMFVDGKPQKSDAEFAGVRDSNGRLCAMFKIVSDMDGFTYDSNNGVVKFDDRPGEDRVYVSPDERVLKVFHSGYEPLQIILGEFGIQLQPKDVWQIKIHAQAKLGDLLPVTIFVQPQDAAISVDGKSASGGKPVKLSKGRHKLRLTKSGFQTRKETITVSAQHVVFNFTLNEVELQPVQIRTIPAGAQIFWDGQAKGETGKGLWQFPGTYRLKLIKPGYVEIDKSVEVRETGENVFSYHLVKNSGNLSLSVTPANAKVLLNKEDYSNRSNLELAPGRYKIEISKAGYKPLSESITIERGRTVRRTYSLVARTGKLRFNVQPLDARVRLKQNGRTLQSWTGMKYLKGLQIGRYALECSAGGYGTQTENVTIAEQQTAVVEVNLRKRDRVANADRVGSPSNMVFIKGGSFQMGDTFGEGSSSEKPVHSVTVGDFYMSKYEVTFAEYDKFCQTTGRKKPDDRGWGRGKRPVINVSWRDAVAYCQWLSKQTGEKYRLPTEAEWEYAAREGGKKVRFGNGKDIADPAEINFNGSKKYKKSYSRAGVYRKKTVPVGSFAPNALGLYDMSGNVWEWCADWYDAGYYKNSPSHNPTGPSSGEARVLRGGSWNDLAYIIRCAYRYRNYPDNAGFSLGFRLAQNVR